METLIEPNCWRCGRAPWADEDATGWLDGHWWWIAVTAAAGLAVGLLRYVLRMPPRQAGLTEEAAEQYVEPSGVPSTGDA